MKRGIAAALVIANICTPESGFAVVPPARMPYRTELAFVQGKQEPGYAALDAQLETAAVTAQLIRSYSVLLNLTEQFLGLMATLRKIIPQQAESESQMHARDVTLQKEAQIRDARDTALESYLRLIGEIESNHSIDEVTAHVAAVDRSMDFRGQGSIKTALPLILLHIHLIHEHAAPSREAALDEISALPTR